MKLIPVNTTVSVSATTENPNYPAENMLNNSPKKKWISNSISSQTVTVNLRAGSSSLALFNLNGISSISISSEDGFNVEWGGSTQWGGSTEWGERQNPGISLSRTINIDNGSAWFDFGVTINDGTELTIDITSNLGSFPSIGIITSGDTFKCDDPSPGWSYEFTDYSVVTELSNGSFDSRDRDTVRMFSGNFYMLIDSEFFAFSRLVRNSIKMNPAAWFFASKKEEEEYLLYARFTNMPSSTMTDLSNSNKAQVSLSIIEEV
jgi:hypothetical protein